MSLEELEEKKERNKKQRREFVKDWADYVRTHDDEVWSKQQNIIINSQIPREKSEER